MNTLRKQILIGLAALSMGTTAVGAMAQTQPQPQEGRHGHAMTMEQRQAKMAEMWQKHVTKLHDSLKLTSAQEPAWNTFVNAIKPQPMAKPDRAAWAALTAPQRMEKMIAMSKERTTRMESHLAALNTFYNQLTPEQKKTFDQQTLRSTWEGEHGGYGEHGMKKG
ncbi:Spy/CpxP family protein refolding chaperone [Massilia horti]|uniref:LTXXQ motif family protein n=1 Tax=Massilia horti TaxID=2562153 RepID=A0A4Y9SR88_9BURK|nr:Spy/CpxP family protein refolding chaperone [Massilia horti]TFW27859.1 hypothetical protein E4O92_22740 [Massilia horti]